MHAVLNAPGSWHDSHIAEALYSKLLHNTPAGYRGISDTAFPRCTNRLDYRIVAPMKKGNRLPQSPGSYSRLKVFNQQLVSARQAAEWGMCSLQGSFAHLKLPMPANDHEYRGEILELAVRMHQVQC